MPSWYYANTENTGIRPSKYRYFGIGKKSGIPDSGFRDPGIEIPSPSCVQQVNYARNIAIFIELIY
jgi:hypothetical protein